MMDKAASLDSVGLKHALIFALAPSPSPFILEAARLPCVEGVTTPFPYGGGVSRFLWCCVRAEGTAGMI